MKYFILILFLLPNIKSYTQIISSYDLNGKVYNKLTGKKISDKKMYQLFQNDPDIGFETIVNKYGKIERFEYDPNNPNESYSRSEDNQLDSGELFPDFVFKSIDDEIIDNNELKGSFVLIRFELFSNEKMLGMKRIQDLDSQIKGLKEEYKITSVLCFSDSEENLKKVTKLKEFGFKLVGNGRLFLEKFDIVKCPTTIILNQTGHVIGYYSDGFLLEELLK